MPEPKISFCLHSVAAATGHQLSYLSVGVGEKRPVQIPLVALLQEMLDKYHDRPTG